MKDDNEKNLDYDKRISLHNEIINNSNEFIYKNINSNTVNDKKDIKKEVNDKNNEVSNSENGGSTKFILKFIIALFEVTIALLLCAAVLVALVFGICTLMFSGI